MAGIRICEHLPRTARWMHKAAIVRTVNHRAACHNTLPAFTGHEVVVTDQSNADPNHPPSMGSVCEYLARRREGERGDGLPHEKRGDGGRGPLPAYVCLPHHLGWGELGHRPGIYGGFLGSRYDPLCGDPMASFDPDADKQNRRHPPEIRGEPRVPTGSLQAGLTLDRLSARKSLLTQLDEQLSEIDRWSADVKQADAISAPAGYSKARQRAFDLLTSKPLRDAFDLDREDPRLRDRYGRSLFGSSALVARKLVEAGVRFVNVFWDNYAPRLQCQDFGWDTHMYNFITLRDTYLPRLDRTHSALLEDLDGRGLLDETLVVILSDFGRTPRINNDAGRDHWSYCYSVVLAGAGIRGGTIYGQSDAQAAFPKDRPVSTADVCATIYRCLGIDPEMPVYDRLSRPHAVAQGGKPLSEILA